MTIGRLLARLVVGGLFVGHGTQKLLGAFEGPGIDGTSQMMESLEMRPAKVNAYAAGVTETAGGAMLALGAATPLAAASLIGVMITAIRKVHLPNGPWNSNQGYEYNLVLITALLAVAESGPGPISVDRIRGRKSSGGIVPMLAALGIGAAASTAVIELSRRAAPKEIDLTETEGAPAPTDAPPAGL